MLNKKQTSEMILGISRSLEGVKTVTGFRITPEGLFVDIVHPIQLKNFLDYLLAYSLEHSFPTIQYRSEQFYSELEADTFTCSFYCKLHEETVDFFQDLALPKPE